MKRNDRFFNWLSVVLISIAGAFQASAAQQILTFDDGNYGGLQWNDFGFADGSLYWAGSGFRNGIVSPNNVAYTYNGGTATLSGSRPFDLLSGYFTGAWKDGLQMEVKGFVGTVLTYDNTYTVSTANSTFITLNYSGVDEVVFSSSGGSLNPAFFGYINPPADVVVMDNLTIAPSPIPEPCPLSLLAFSAMAMIIWRATGNKSIA
jgi:hypothetical protein